MHYIKKEKRALFDGYINQILNNIRNYSKGDANSMMAYIIYKLIKTHYGSKGDWEQKSDALKILSDITLEYYRRIIAPYSDIKIEQNGDV